MQERTPDKLGLLLVDIANGEKNATIDAMIVNAFPARKDFMDRIKQGLSVLSSGILDRVISGEKFFRWAVRNSFETLVLREDRYVFETWTHGMERQAAWSLGEDFSSDDNVRVLTVFDRILARGGIESLDPSRIGKCQLPGCSRYFYSDRSRFGKRASAACDPHRTAFAHRRNRQGAHYREVSRGRDTERKRAHREARKLIYGWIEAGLTHKVISSRLRKWNEGQGSPLGEKAINNLLEEC